MLMKYWITIVRKLYLIAGGTAGHVYTCLSFAKYVIKKYDSSGVFFITDVKGWHRFNKAITAVIKQENIIIIKSYGNHPGVKNKIKAILLNTLGFIQSLIKIKNNSVIIGFGGYVTLPSILAGFILRGNIFLHEQNVILGLANRLCQKIAKLTMLSLPIKNKKKGSFIETGLPLREEFITHCPTISSSEDIKIVVMGGSLSAPFLNSWVPKSLGKLHLKNKLKVIHHSGSAKQEVEELYKKNGITAQVYEFLEKPWELLKNASLVICRGGAASLYEIASLQKPMVVVPFPKASNNHQLYNGLFFQNLGVAKVIEEKDENNSDLILLCNTDTIKKMTKCYHKKFFPDGSKNIYEIIDNYM